MADPRHVASQTVSANPDASHPSVWYESVSPYSSLQCLFEVMFWLVPSEPRLWSFNLTPLMGQGTVWRAAALLPFPSVLTCRL